MRLLVNAPRLHPPCARQIGRHPTVNLGGIEVTRRSVQFRDKCNKLIRLALDHRSLAYLKKVA